MYFICNRDSYHFDNYMIVTLIQLCQIATETTTIIEALNKFVTHRISALPIVVSKKYMIQRKNTLDSLNNIYL